MRNAFGAILALFLIGLHPFMIGQDQSPQSADDPSLRSAPAPAVSALVGLSAATADQDDLELPQIPAFLGGRNNQLALAGEMERSNFLRGGVNVTAAYNDNAFLTPTGQVGNTTYSVFPNISIVESTSRVRWSLGYGGGLTVNQRLSNQDSGSHNLNVDSLFRISPHVSLHAAENFFMVSGIFGATAASDFQTGSGGANNTLITPLANQRASQTVVEANYRFALKDLVGASGSYYDLHYSDQATGQASQTNQTLSLTNTQTASGSIFWLHELFPRDWAGVSYRFQRITYDPSGETRVHSFSFTDTLSISKTLHVSGFIGPEYSESQGLSATGSGTAQVANSSDWGASGGVEGGWQSARTTVTAGYSRQITDGAGVLGAVHLQNAHAAIRRELFTGWAANVMASYGSNQAITLATVATATSFKTTTVGVSIERNIGKSLGFQVGYFHDLQEQSGAPQSTSSQNYNVNRVFATLSYQWTKPLGR